MTSSRSESHKVSPSLLSQFCKTHSRCDLNVSCWCFFQMTRCPDRAIRCRQLKTSWTSTGTSRGPARVMERQVDHLMMGQEVKIILYIRISHILRWIEQLTSLCFCLQIFVLRTAYMTLPEMTLYRTCLQTTSQTRLARRPNSTTQSFLSGLCPAANLQNSHLHSLTQDSLKNLSNWFHFFWVLVF